MFWAATVSSRRSAIAPTMCGLTLHARLVGVRDVRAVKHTAVNDGKARPRHGRHSDVPQDSERTVEAFLRSPAWCPNYSAHPCPRSHVLAASGFAASDAIEHLRSQLVCSNCRQRSLCQCYSCRWLLRTDRVDYASSEIGVAIVIGKPAAVTLNGQGWRRLLSDCERLQPV
jgi:hypothetical protein